MEWGPICEHTWNVILSYIQCIVFPLSLISASIYYSLYVVIVYVWMKSQMN